MKATWLSLRGYRAKLLGTEELYELTGIPSAQLVDSKAGTDTSQTAGRITKAHR
jgi:hypothetical protein